MSETAIRNLPASARRKKAVSEHAQEHAPCFSTDVLDMKALVVYYSRTGTTRKVAEAISKILKCDIDEIVDTKNRNGPLGYLISGREAMRKQLTEIKKPKRNPKLYDVVIIGTPVWGFTMSSPVRTYLTQSKGLLKKAAFFCTHGGMPKTTCRDMEELCGKKAVGSMYIHESEVGKGEHISKIRELVREIKK